MYHAREQGAGSGIRIGLMESHTLGRQALAAALASSGGVHVALSCDTAVPPEVVSHRCAQNGVDVLVVAVSAEDGGIQPRILSDSWSAVVTRTRLIALAAHKAPGTIAAFLGAGACGYLVRDEIDLDRLIDAIRAVSDGCVVLCPGARQALLQGSANTPRLTQRELQVVRALLEGRRQSRKRTAAGLGISLSTLNNHIANIAAKLGVASVPDLLAQCRALGLLDLNT